MACYAIVPKDKEEEVLIVECDFVELNSGFFEFYNELGGVPEVVKYYSSDMVESVNLQNEYTLEEKMEQMGVSNNG